MHNFHYRDDKLFCEDLPLERIANEVGTPCYIYSLTTLQRHFRVFDSAFLGIDHLICFSVKSNSNIAILRLFASMGGGTDIVSSGELFRSLKAGVPPEKIVYSGVGKRDEDIEYALRSNILMFNVESMQEIEAINRIAGRLGKKAPIALRVNPDVDPMTHPYISTGLKENKFGLDIKDALSCYVKIASLPNITIRGVDCHIGSQLTDVSPFIDALKKIRTLINALRKNGIEISYLDLGGGLGITYFDEMPPDPEEYAAAVLEILRDLNLTLILEPGRAIVGNAGILLAKVIYVKHSGSKRFVIIDAAMNDLIRPALYHSYHAIKPVIRRDAKSFIVDVVGPICESSDFIAKERSLPEVSQGDLLAIMSAGAYGFAMSSNYNSRVKACEVLVNGEQMHIIRERESYEDLIKGERIPDFIALGRETS